MQPQEKREFLRVPFTTEVEVRTEDRSFGSSSGINISLNGLKLATEQPVPEKGSPWTAKIMLRAFEKQVIQVIIEAHGRVARSGQGTLAVEFMDLDLDSYLHLRQLIICNTDDTGRTEREFDAHWGIRRSQK
jgi:hypothetical protein